LYRGDRLIVQNKSVIERGGVVTIEGEVVMPGSYPIIRDSTTLSQIVAMAGGLTTYASLQSSIVMRPKKSEQVTIDSVQLKRGLTSLENTEYLLHEISINSLFSPVQADFVSLFEKGDNTKDIKMLDGDKIIITSKINAVYVFGEVKNPGFIPFKPGKNAEYYITQSGGITTHAELEDMRVIKASSKQWLIPGETSLEEGDYLWIPKEPYRPFGYYLSVYSQVFGIVGTVATLFILVVR
jgi:protein involved in polysaccharide export with SLBB domain